MFLLGHAVEGLASLQELTTEPRLPIADGVNLVITELESGRFRVNERANVLVDVPASNGHLYIVDSVLVG